MWNYSCEVCGVAGRPALRWVLPGLVIAGFWHTGAATQGVATVSCTSDGSRRHCPADTSAGVALTRSTGTASCLLGRTWGYDAQSVWVTEGCGGEFVVGNAGHESERIAAVDEAQSVEMPQAPAPAVLEDEAQTDEMPQAPELASTASQEPGTGFYVYTRFGAAAAFSQSDAELQENGSRVRFEYSRGEHVRFFTVGEWGINLTRGATVFNAGETTSGGFVVLDSIAGEVLGARLGYVGVAFPKAGTVTLGKQWSVHYDVAGYTDAFNAFGADASATFNAQSDGGLMGTGRADGALTYRKENLLDFLDFGAQVQIRSFENDDFLDGYGFSLRAQLSQRIEAGFSYSRAIFDEVLKRDVLGLDSNGVYAIAGLRYESDSLTLGAVYAQQRNGDLVRIPVPEDGEVPLVPEVFDANGIELFARYQLGSFGLLAGFLNYEIVDGNVLIDPNALTRYYIGGVDFTRIPGTRLYAEYRLSKGIDALGQRSDDILVLGAKYEFSTSGAVR